MAYGWFVAIKHIVLNIVRGGVYISCASDEILLGINGKQLITIV